MPFNNARAMKVQAPGAPNYRMLILRFTSSRQWDRVLETAREWLAQDPESTQAHQAAGQALINLKRHAEAEPHLARVLGRNPQSGMIHRWMSVIHFNQKKLPAADESIHRALSLNPLDTYNWYHLAWMLYKQGDTVSARKYAEKALELAPRNPDTINLLALCTPKGPGSAAKVLQQYREALALDPEKPVVHNNIGVYHLNVDKDYTAAEECFRRALFFDPSLRIARTNLFVTLKKRDKVYRLLTVPKDYIFRLFSLKSLRGRQGRVMYVGALIFWILAFRFVFAALAIWFLLVWPMVKGYEYLTIGDIRAQAGELGARRGGLFGYRRWPLRLRLGLFAMLLILFWGGLAVLCFRNGISPLSDNAQVGFGLIIFLGLVIFVGVHLRFQVKKNWNRFFARRRAKKFDHLLKPATGKPEDEEDYVV